MENDGSIKKFYNGFLKKFVLEAVSPTLASPTRIFTTSKSDFLYILEPKQNRLVVYKKTGELAAQYVGADLTDLRDALVIEKEKNIYLLNGSSVYSLPAEHLESRK